MMNCHDTQKQFDNYLDQQFPEELQSVFHSHLAECEQCREALTNEEHFRTSLTQLPIEPMSPGFAARALRNARIQGSPAHRRLLPAAVAASVLLLFSFVIMFQGSLAASKAESVTLALLEEREITLAFHSPQPIQHASFEIQLPEGVEIKGYPEWQLLAWDGSLKRGQNILRLPLIVRSGNGGELKAVIHRQNRNRVFSVNIEVAANNIS